MRSLKNAQINLCTWSFSLLKDCFCLNWSCLFTIFLQECFSQTESGLPIWKRQIVWFINKCLIYLFILLTNTKLLNYHISVLPNFYIFNKFNKIHDKIYLLLISIPKLRLLGHVFLPFSLKLIESHTRIRLVKNFS